MYEFEISIKIHLHGDIAQLVERKSVKFDVTGSIPVVPAISLCNSMAENVFHRYVVASSTLAIATIKQRGKYL